MRAVLDACVLYPTVMQRMLLGAARAGLYEPRWSPRIEEEWARAAARKGQEAAARGEIALAAAAFPRARVSWPPELERRLWLPDPADVHVLAAAIASSSDVIVTSNAKDFPRNVLADEGLSRADPDALLLGFHEASPEPMRAVAEEVLAEARRLSGQEWQMRALMKKARLPRLGKVLT
ncbi:RSP_2648 family PIN domain-containing protein [Pseudoroseicyclus tamaricis]|uniref:PIN domain-containing protein n=1 Tax=Pseudoroseicyclus tamaricis TaxID=2705421 RepID=A0A6B2K307_9RHOB|nr:PIN domain-containing protein [Pseudoroseicyclus tamaricis]NDV00876.1 PIN domain-containing protein [Pseudoroseicyclus tamaricis]